MKLLILILLVFINSYAFCEETVLYKSPVVNSEAYAVADEIGNVKYQTTNKQYYFVKGVIDPFSFLLILDETSESQFLGDEVSKSNIKLTAWPIQEGKIGSKQWTIEHEGHTWEIKKNEIIIISKGCCDNPDRKYKFHMRTGQAMEK